MNAPLAGVRVLDMATMLAGPYGATLLGMMEDEYYQALCALSDFLGAETRLAGPPAAACCG